MRNLAAANRTYLLCRNSYDCRCPSGESYKFDFVSFVTRVHMHHCPDVTWLQALILQGRGQNYPVVFVNHTRTILERVRGDQSWKIRTAVDDPDGPDGR